MNSFYDENNNDSLMRTDSFILKHSRQLCIYTNLSEEKQLTGANFVFS